MNRWRWVSKRAVLSDLNYLLSLSSNFVDELCKKSKQSNLGKTDDDDRWMQFFRSDGWDMFWFKLLKDA